MGYKAHSGFSFLEIHMKLFLISLIPKIVKPKMKKKGIKIPETTDFSPEAFKKNRKRDGYLLKQMPNFSNVLFLACNNFFTFSRKLSQFSISLGKPKASTILPYR